MRSCGHFGIVGHQPEHMFPAQCLQRRVQFRHRRLRCSGGDPVQNLRDIRPMRHLRLKHAGDVGNGSRDHDAVGAKPIHLQIKTHRRCRDLLFRLRLGQLFQHCPRPNAPGLLKTEKRPVLVKYDRFDARHALPFTFFKYAVCLLPPLPHGIALFGKGPCPLKLVF